jgi:hypothetical protein
MRSDHRVASCRDRVGVGGDPLLAAAFVMALFCLPREGGTGEWCGTGHPLASAQQTSGKRPPAWGTGRGLLCAPHHVASAPLPSPTREGTRWGPASPLCGKDNVGAMETPQTLGRARPAPAGPRLPRSRSRRGALPVYLSALGACAGQESGVGGQGPPTGLRRASGRFFQWRGPSRRVERAEGEE